MINWLKPSFFSQRSKQILPCLVLACLVSFLSGIHFAFFNSPPDYQQGEAVRIMYVHVPAAWLSLGIYSVVTLMSLSYLVWRNPLAFIIAKESAFIGTAFTAIALSTGAIWGKPMWGTWWVWDARLTSMLILFFFYLSYLALTFSDLAHSKMERAASLLAIIGFINIPIIKYSVDFWHSLHQPAGVLRLTGSTVHPSILKPLLIMFAAHGFLFLSLLVVRINTTLLSTKLKRIQQESSTCES